MICYQCGVKKSSLEAIILCDPCLLGLDSTQIHVDPSGGGWSFVLDLLEQDLQGIPV